MTTEISKASAPQPDSRHVQLPLVPSDQPGSVNLTEAQIADLLDDDDGYCRCSQWTNVAREGMNTAAAELFLLGHSP